MKKAVRAVKEHDCDVVVGTPGRVVNLVEKGALNTSAVRLLVRRLYFCQEEGGAFFSERFT